MEGVPGPGGVLMMAVYFMPIPLLSVCTFSCVFVSLCTVGSDVWLCMDIVMYALAFQTTIRTFCMVTGQRSLSRCLWVVEFVSVY